MKTRTSFVTGPVTLAFAILAAAAGGVVATWGGSALYAQAAGFRRVELQRHDLQSMAGREAVMARAEINVGAGTPKHTHPGEEVAYVLEGQVTVEVEGKPPTILKAGDVFFIPAGQVHAAKNSGTTAAKVLATYVVEKGKPLAVPVK